MYVYGTLYIFTFFFPVHFYWIMLWKIVHLRHVRTEFYAKALCEKIKNVQAQRDLCAVIVSMDSTTGLSKHDRFRRMLHRSELLETVARTSSSPFPFRKPIHSVDVAHRERARRTVETGGSGPGRTMCFLLTDCFCLRENNDNGCEPATDVVYYSFP